MAPVLASAGPINGIVPSLIVLLCWLPYRARARTLSQQRRAVPGWRQACFAAGLILLAIALSQPVDSLADELLVAHMAEHLLIGDIAALLIVLGFTGPLLVPLLRVRWLAPLRVFAHPLVALPAWMISFYVWHLPALYQAALRHDWIHALQHACFLGFGIAVWMALLGPLPKPTWFNNAARLIYIIAVRLAGTIMANVLIFSGTVLYPIYRVGDAKWHISPMGDQIAAAGLMMVEESVLTIGLFCWLFLRVAREAEERQTLLEAAAAHGVQLDERRAARAVAAGRGEELLIRVTRAGSGELPDRAEDRATLLDPAEELAERLDRAQDPAEPAAGENPAEPAAAQAENPAEPAAAHAENPAEPAAAPAQAEPV